VFLDDNRYPAALRGCSSVRQSTTFATEGSGVQIPSPPPGRYPSAAGVSGVFGVSCLELEPGFRARSVRDRVGDELFEAVGGDFVEGFVDVPVDVQRGLDRGVPKPRLQQLRVGAICETNRASVAPAAMRTRSGREWGARVMDEGTPLSPVADGSTETWRPSGRRGAPRCTFQLLGADELGHRTRTRVRGKSARE
jgi:hypothetical protein